jgi:tetratricopeptide (TPR) repeat protein/transcriptional regulator with XRE-family HTH domain
MTDDAVAFGNRLCACRQAAGLSQQELADRSGLSTRTISNLEHGRTRWPHPDSVRRLADALDLRDESRREFFAAAGRRLPGLSSRLLGPPEPPPAPAGDQVTPRLLPGPVRQFVGREAELGALSSLLDPVDGPLESVIAVIGGTAGVGKTALAVHWAQQAAGHFPDGQLYVNLRGYDPGQPMTAADALAGFLRALGVTGQSIPADVSERAARFRSLLAGRRMLVVLDNARHVEQIRPLLPGSPGCVTVVTSRDALPGLVARDGAIRVALDLLPAPEAVGLLRMLIGHRVDDDLDSATTLAARCARLPLALRVAAELAAARPDTSLAGLAGELTAQQLDMLAAGGDPHTGIRAVFSWSYDHLDPEAARLFRLVGLHPGRDLDVYAAAALAGVPVTAARQLLAELTRAHLIDSPRPGRYAQHDLLRAYAGELALAHEADGGRAVLSRLFAYYLHGAATAIDLLFPAESYRRPQIPPPATDTAPIPGPAEAIAWLDAELANLAACAEPAAACAATGREGGTGYAVLLPPFVSRFLANGGHHSEAIVIYTCALAAARATGDRAAEATTLSHLSHIDWLHGRSQKASTQLEQALALFRETGDQVGEARVLHNLATVEAQMGRYQQAREREQQALELYEAAGNRAGGARAMHGLSNLDLRTGHYERAAASLRQALEVCRESGDRFLEAFVLGNMVDLNLRLGRYQHATRYARRCLTLFREVGDRKGESWALTNLGAVCVGQGHGQQAIGLCQQAVVIVRGHDQFGEAEAINGLGEAYLAAGRPRQARSCHLIALDLTRQIEDKYEEARAHAGLARTQPADASPARTLEHWRRALALYDALGTPEAAQIRALLATGAEMPARPGLTGPGARARS